MTLQRNHYEVLGVPSTATTDQIKKKYRELARKFHPDVVKDKALGQKIFTQVNQAYRILADPERRAQYDAALRAERAAANGAAPAANGTRPAAANGAAAPTGPLTPQQTQSVSRLISDADLALLSGDGEAARTHCEDALKIDSRNARALGLLGDALTLLGKRDEAAVAYRRSLEITPSSILQAKLSRLEASSVGTRTNPSATSGRPTNGTAPAAGGARAQSATTTADKSAGGLFGRLLGKKK